MRGSLDAAFVSVWDALQVDAGNDQPVCFLVADVSHGADGIVARSGIDSMAALRGKRVGAKQGTSNLLILLEALRCTDCARTRSRSRTSTMPLPSK